MMIASEIVQRLAERHSKDVFVSECKDGPTWAANHLRLDAWAMTRSWVKFCTYGYEIKVSRSDFIKDAKLQNYLPLCNLLFVVAPAGVVLAMDELPEGVGLLSASPAHSRLITKKKAAFREIPDPVDLYRYVLMSRVRIAGHDIMRYGMSGQDSADFWAKWLIRREVNQDLGRHVSQKLRETINKKIEEVTERMSAVMTENEHYREIKEILESFGISTRCSPSTWEVQRKLKAYKDGFPEELKQILERSKRDASDFMRSVDELTKALSEQHQGRGVWGDRVS
jgi:hypothetical protein